MIASESAENWHDILYREFEEERMSLHTPLARSLWATRTNISFGSRMPNYIRYRHRSRRNSGNIRDRVRRFNSRSRTLRALVESEFIDHMWFFGNAGSSLTIFDQLARMSCTENQLCTQFINTHHYFCGHRRTHDEYGSIEEHSANYCNIPQVGLLQARDNPPSYLERRLERVIQDRLDSMCHWCFLVVNYSRMRHTGVYYDSVFARCNSCQYSLFSSYHRNECLNRDPPHYTQ
ncbi:hypothetical protein RF11_07505 [Thelohanellus kitauei]|uniref:Uncharacterized protein n=1 Tax=Thelohanellus kitauei TaxID=669202 RepID=A0A0C2I8Q0_THEKT|nr:hypothetical protein RF11_07505 [Thelohanellus kitauei]